MTLFSAIVTLFLVMAPLGNLPAFVSVLKTVAPERRRVILLREIVIAYFVLLLFVFFGNYGLRFLHLDQEAIGIAGGIVLFLIALGMIFPGQARVLGNSSEGEPFVVPLAIPLFAGPSTLATILLLHQAFSSHIVSLLLAVTIAWALSAIILLVSPFLFRVLRERGLIAIERLMGMLLVMVAVEMLLNGLKSFLTR